MIIFSGLDQSVFLAPPVLPPVLLDVLVLADALDLLQATSPHMMGEAFQESISVDELRTSIDLKTSSGIQVRFVDRAKVEPLIWMELEVAQSVAAVREDQPDVFVRVAHPDVEAQVGHLVDDFLFHQDFILFQEWR